MTSQHVQNAFGRKTDRSLVFFQHSLVIILLAFIFSAINALTSAHQDTPQTSRFSESVLINSLETVSLPEDTVEDIQAPSVLSLRMQGALDYVNRRYRVSTNALIPIFQSVETLSTERNLDPMLVVSVIIIESRFNPYAESSIGAQGLMQILPKYHMDKLPAGSTETALLNPDINVQVGCDILVEALHRTGNLVDALQYYGGASSDPSTKYANKVLAMKNRLDTVGKRYRSRVLAGEIKPRFPQTLATTGSHLTIMASAESSNPLH